MEGKEKKSKKISRIQIFDFHQRIKEEEKSPPGRLKWGRCQCPLSLTHTDVNCRARLNRRCLFAYEKMKLIKLTNFHV